MKHLNSRSLVYPLLALLGLWLLIGVCRAETNTTACAVYSGDRLLGIVEDKDAAKKVIGEVCREKKRRAASRLLSETV